MRFINKYQLISKTNPIVLQAIHPMAYSDIL
jgi:hypothetical protein